MISKDYLPSPELSEYICQYRLRHFIFQPGFTPRPKPFPPRPEQTLTFYIRGTETSRHLDGTVITKPRSVLSGQFTSRIDRFVSYPEILMLIVDLKPGALHRLTGIPFKEFTNIDIDAETVFSSEIRKVNNRLSSTADYTEMIIIVESFFRQLVAQSKKSSIAVDNVLTLATDEPDHSIDWLARNAFLSPRQLERKFAERIGISPKMFLRIARFNKSYWLRLKQPDLNWFQIAMSCGYTDYQHLVKEYKEFANSNPVRFFMEESNAPGRVLGLTKD